MVLAEDDSVSVFKANLLGGVGADGGGYWWEGGGGGGVSTVQEGGREPAGGAGPAPVVQWRVPLTGSVSYRPGRHGRASQMAAAAAAFRCTSSKEREGREGGGGLLLWLHLLQSVVGRSLAPYLPLVSLVRAVLSPAALWEISR